YGLQLVNPYPNDWFALPDYVSALPIALILVVSIWQASQRNFLYLFFLLWMALTILPFSFFTFGIERGIRYLYLPAAGFSAWVGIALAQLATRVQTRAPLLRWAFVLLVLGLTLLGGIVLRERESSFAILVRQSNRFLNEIHQFYPTLMPSTEIYLINVPFATLHVGSALRLRYNLPLTVKSQGDGDTISPNADPHLPLVILYWVNGHVQNYPADRAAMNQTRVKPRLPIEFQDNITLVGYAVPNPNLARGQDLLVLLTWKVRGAVHGDYTIFNHVVGANDQIAGQFDGKPQSGKRTTQTWRAGQLIITPFWIPIEPNAAPNDNYQLKVGLYSAETGQRLNILPTNGNPTSTAITIQPISIH
ncbi:MAG TPA: hypothetical protein VFD70_31600, partial [Anaerolineae bacterium]|nr:hypothetical protein [Anaerolineae bacterium]